MRLIKQIFQVLEGDQAAEEAQVEAEEATADSEVAATAEDHLEAAEAAALGVAETREVDRINLNNSVNFFFYL